MRDVMSNRLTQRPLAAYPLHATRDIDQARDATSRVYCHHRLNADRSSQFNACHNHVPMGRCSLNYLEFGTDVSIVPGYLPDFYLFQLPLNGGAHVVTGKHEIDMVHGQGTVLNPEHYTSMQWNADCQMLMVSVQEDAAVQQLAKLLGRPVDKKLRFHPELDQNIGGQGAWMRFVRFLASEVDQASPECLKSLLFREMRSTLLTSLLLSLPHNFSEGLCCNDQRITPASVKLAIDFIEAHYQEPINIEQLVELTGVSMRSLFDCFRRFVSCTPMQYLRKVRLQHARDRLRKGNPEDSVTETAFDCGFTQLGRFSAWYKEVYGESPSATYRAASHNPGTYFV